MEVLLVRFTHPQRVFIRKEARRTKKSEAAIVRESIEHQFIVKRKKK